MKKLIALLLCISIAFVFTACKDKETGEETTATTQAETEDEGNMVGLPNPITDIEKSEYDNALGFESIILEDAENILYQHIDGVEIYQVNFTYEDDEYTFRFSTVSEDISGYYYEWDVEEKMKDFNLQYYTAENAGVTTWTKDNNDTTYNYCLSSSTASLEDLISTTEYFFAAY